MVVGICVNWDRGLVSQSSQSCTAAAYPLIVQWTLHDIIYWQCLSVSGSSCTVSDFPRLYQFLPLLAVTTAFIILIHRHWRMSWPCVTHTGMPVLHACLSWSPGKIQLGWLGWFVCLGLFFFFFSVYILAHCFWRFGITWRVPSYTDPWALFPDSRSGVEVRELYFLTRC